MEAHILYELNSADHKTKDWLSTSSKTDEALLDKASKDGRWVRVKGTMMVGVEAKCKWVKVSSVTPVKKSFQLHVRTALSSVGGWLGALYRIRNTRHPSRLTELISTKILIAFDRTQIDAIGARSVIADLVFRSHRLVKRES